MTPGGNLDPIGPYPAPPHLAKSLDVTHRVWEDINKKNSQKSQKTAFWPNFNHFLILQKEPYNIWCIILHVITGQNFKQNWQHFGEFWPKKIPKSSLKWQFLLIQKHLKITRELQIRYQWNIPCMCTTLALFIYWKLNITWGAAEGASKKPSGNLDFIKILALISLKNNS